jgi:PKD repeat protein
MRGIMKTIKGRPWLTLGVGLALVGLSCGLDKVTIPPLSGPSELALSIRLTVNPDVITADGFSTALVQAEVRGPDARPVANQDVYFQIADGVSAGFADIGTLNNNRGQTNGSGITQVIYTAPPRTDNTANRTVLITARPVGNDANGFVYRTVRLELRSPEPRLFPQTPGNQVPICSFAVEYPQGTGVGSQILFQSTSSDIDGVIIRYFWDFGDGENDDKPDVNHAYGFAGSFTVTHIVTDNGGAQKACTLKLIIQ